MTKGLFICKLCCVILFLFVLCSGNNSDNWHFSCEKNISQDVIMVSFSKKKKKKAHVLSSLLFLLASGTILMPLVCIEQGTHPLEGVQDGVSQPHHCEGASVWRVGCTHKAHENLSGFGGVHLCQGQTTAVGDWLQSTRADQIGKYFRNNEKYQQRRKLKYWERENYN